MLREAAISWPCTGGGTLCALGPLLPVSTTRIPAQEWTCGFLAVFSLTATSKTADSASGRRDAGGGHEANLNPELTELSEGREASVPPLTAGVLPTDEMLVGLQQPPDFRVVVDRVL